MKNLLFVLLAVISCSLFAQNTLEVGLRNGEVLYPKTIQYKNPLLKRPHLLLNDEEEIDLDNVDYYQTSEDYFIFRSIGKGLSYSNHTKLRRVENGAIQVFEYTYTTTSMSGAGVNGAPGMMTTHTVTNYYIQNERGEMELLNRSKVRALVEDDPKSLELLGKRKSRTLQNIGFYVVGGAITLVSIVSWAMKENEDTSNNMEDTSLNLPPTLFLGVAIMWIPTLRNMIDPKTEDSFVTIIADYNSRH